MDRINKTIAGKSASKGGMNVSKIQLFLVEHKIKTIDEVNVRRPILIQYLKEYVEIGAPQPPPAPKQVPVYSAPAQNIALHPGDIGVIFHWGIYSVPAYDDVKSAQRRKMKNGSEWYLKRLTEKGEYRPISGWKETQSYHQDNYGDKDYYEFTVDFDEDSKSWDPEEWFKHLKNKNIKYAIITTKHHDGVCLWDTKTTINKTKRNIVKEFIDCAHKYGLLAGVYYSWYEFDKSATINYMNTVVPQIKELEQYNPDLWWFDGDWVIKSKTAKNIINTLTLEMSSNNKMLNSRIADSKNYSYKVFGDRTMSDEKNTELWEYIFTIGLSWGYNRQQTFPDYMTGRDIVTKYREVVAKGGLFLINFGPKSTGELDPFELQAYQDFLGLL